MDLELIETQDNGKRVVPYNTGRVQIGRCWQPKLTPTQASWGEHYKPSSGVGKWLWACLGAIAAFVVLVVRHG